MAKSKHVLVTGGAGFIGHHVIDLLVRKTDWQVTCLDRLDFSGTLNRLSDILAGYSAEDKKRVNVVFHDLKAEINPIVESHIGCPDIILHLAAGSHVDRSISFPLEFVYDNVIGTANILEYARRLHEKGKLETFLYFSTDEVFGPAPGGVLYKERDRYNSTNPYSASKAAGEEICVSYENTYQMPIMITHCHDDQTRCWTENGFASVEELEIGDLVWTLKDNKELKLEPILEIVNNHYEGEMIEFKSRKYDLKVTPNHRMLTRKRGEKDYYIKTADEIYASTEREHIPLTGTWNGKLLNSDVIDISSYLTNDLHYNSNRIPGIYNAEKFVEFIGWYVSEGWTRSTGSGTGIAQKDPTNLSAIRECLSIFGLPVSEQVVQSGTTILTIHSKQIGSFLKEQFGLGSYDKRLPNWIKEIDIKYLRILFDTLVKGDGTKSNSGCRYYTVSEKLAADVAEIGIKLGYSATIKTRKTQNKNFGRGKVVESYYVAFCKSGFGSVEKNHKAKSTYSGKIWCIRTGSGNFFVERNGIISCSGNTMNVFGERQSPEKFIPMTIRKVSQGSTVSIHSDKTKVVAGSRFYIHARDVADAVYFLITNKPKCPWDFGNAHCPKFNVVGREEIDNLSLAKMIAASQGKELFFEMVDFHSSRPGHDLRYGLDGGLMKSLGWEPKIAFSERVKQVSEWYLANPTWLGV